MLVPPFFVVSWTPTEEYRAFVADVEHALKATYDRKVACGVMGIGESLLSEWFSCAKQIGVFRLTSLDQRFWDALIERRAERSGGIYLKADVVRLLQGAAALRRTTLKALLPGAERRTA